MGAHLHRAYQPSFIGAISSQREMYGDGLCDVIALMKEDW